MLSEKKKTYNIVLEKEVKDKINEIALKNDRSASYIINNILKDYIKEYIQKIEEPE